MSSTVTSTADEAATGPGPLMDFLLGHPGDAGAPLVHSAGRASTLGDVITAVRHLAAQFGPVAGTPVACVVDDPLRAVTAMFASWLAGGVYVPLNGRLTDAELAAQLAVAGPATVIAGPGGQDRLPAQRNLLIEQLPGAWVRYRPGPIPDQRFTGDEALIMRTSGTTGEAKAIVLRHAGVQDGIDTVIAKLRGAKAGPGYRAKPPMPNLIPTSLALWAGIWNTLFAFRVGAPVVLLDRFDPVAYAGLVRRFQIRSTILAPAMMAMLLEAPEISDLAPLRYVRSVTAPLPPDQAQRFHRRFGVEVLNSYGQTELGSEVVGWTAADIRTSGVAKLGAVGRAHPGVAIRIMDSSHAELPRGGTGEIWIRSPFAPGASRAVGAGDGEGARAGDSEGARAGDSEGARAGDGKGDGARARAGDGFLCTGDLGRLDDDGFLWIDGRVSDVINRGGLKVVPQEVEEVLRRHPAVADACVAGVPDARLGEVPVAWVRPRAGVPPAPAELLAFARESLASYKTPVAVRFVDDFPRTEIGKVRRRDLVASYSRAAASGPSPSCPGPPSPGPPSPGPSGPGPSGPGPSGGTETG